MKSFFRTLLRTRASAGKEKSLLSRLVGDSLITQRKYYGISIAAMIVVSVTAALTAYLMEGIVDSLTATDNRAQVFLVAFAVVVVFAVKGLATYVQLVFMARAGNRIIADQQKKTFEKLLDHGVSYFTLTESSDLLTRLTHGAQQARRVVDLLVTSVVRDTLTLIGLLAVMFYQQPVLSLICLFIGPMAILGVRSLLKRVRELMQQEMMSLAEIIKVVQETAQGIQVIKVFSLEERMAQRMSGAVRQVENRANSIIRLEAITSPLMETLAGFAIAAVVALSALNLFGATPPTAGQLMSFVTALLMAYEPAKRLSRMRISLEAGLIGVKMMYDLLDYQEDLVEQPDALDLPEGPGRVVFEDVQFGYDNGAPVLRGLNLEFEPGKVTALVGPSGGGKSTILNLAMRLYDPSAGAVRIDGQDLASAKFQSIRQRISFVGQNTFLFADSVMENIRLSRPGASDEDVIEAAKAANAHDFIEKLPQGYHTPVGENGSFLSGGQKQRLSIARAMLRKGGILLLDEATSALDASSEARVKEALARATKGTTTIMIAHRLSTVLEADRIYVVVDGQIAEAGTVQELLNQGGEFKKLFDTQYEGFVTASG
ncbi:ABC transporter ATP-binding protein [Leisingera sp. SS27]|nr:ABC transporter ATP-binding protein [Leisingera sp. SS27]MDC0660234.1 ABC transporter ATP-binding protein [Leisingera sp. SS27]